MELKMKNKLKEMKGRLTISNNLAKAITAVAICAMGAYVMYITKGQTGIGWAILGLMVIW